MSNHICYNLCIEHENGAWKMELLREKDRQLARIFALPYNQYFRQDIERIRNKYKIFREARDYCFVDPSLSDSSCFLKGGSELPQSLLVEIGVHLYMPVDKSNIECHICKDIKEIMNRFGLPNSSLDEIFYHLFFLNNLHEMVIGMEYDVIGYSIIEEVTTLDDSGHFREELKEKLKITLEISRWITKKDWVHIWDDKVKPKLSKLRDASKYSRRSGSPHFVRRQMKRWSEWYQLSQLQGHGPKKALELWEDSHPDEGHKYDQSTVTKAIREFEEIITPRSVTD